jgi:thiol-disulfide isomerase/thioredoxin
LSETALQTPAVNRHRRHRVIAFAMTGAVLAALGIGLFTSAGTSTDGGPPHAGGTAPTFTLSGVNVAGQVGTPGSGGRDGKPVVLLFMGDWCTICHSEIPPLAARIKELHAGHGALSHLAVVGVDSEDSLSDAVSFVKASGATFPVGDDSSAHVMSGLYGFEGDPYAVFIEGNGTIMTIHPGPLSPSELVRLSRKLVST